MNAEALAGLPIVTLAGFLVGNCGGLLGDQCQLTGAEGLFEKRFIV